MGLRFLFFEKWQNGQVRRTKLDLTFQHSPRSGPTKIKAEANTLKIFSHEIE
jgi:hypothetical protein